MDSQTIQHIARTLATEDDTWTTSTLPSTAQIDSFIDTVRQIVFLPTRDEVIAVTLIVEAIRQLEQLISRGACPDDEATATAHRFAGHLPELRRLLRSDVEAIAERDPAAQSLSEVASCYPGATAMLHHRVAHCLSLLGRPLLARIISERAHSLTGIDIHPSATIGASFAIDHGTGIVVGATARIGHHVMLYQGVTLGAKRFEHDDRGRLVDGPRHPIVEDYVTIYSNTSVLGRVCIGHHSVLGGNLWITHDVAPHSQVRQSKPIQHVGFIDGEGI